MTGHVLASGSPLGGIGGLVFFIFAIACYFIPTIVAMMRGIPNAGSVAVINFFWLDFYRVGGGPRHGCGGPKFSLAGRSGCAKCGSGTAMVLPGDSLWGDWCAAALREAGCDLRRLGCDGDGAFRRGSIERQGSNVIACAGE